VTINTDKVFRFISLLKRTKLYHIINELIKNNEEIMDVRLKSKSSLNSECLPHSMLLDSENSQSDEESDDSLSEPICNASRNLYKRFNEIAAVNEQRLLDYDEDFDPDNLEEFAEISDEIFDGIDLKTFYNNIYGEQKYQDGKTFLYKFIEELGNFDISDEPHYPRGSEFSFIDIQNSNLEDDVNREIKQSLYEIRYSHKLNQFMAPPQCRVQETYTSYFVSPTKVHILRKIENSGFPY